MVIIIIILLAAMATWYLPLPGKLIAMAINYAVPDPVPFLDEAIQAVGLLKHLIMAISVMVRLLATLLKWTAGFAILAGGLALAVAFPPLAIVVVGIAVVVLWRRRRPAVWASSIAHGYYSDDDNSGDDTFDDRDND